MSKIRITSHLKSLQKSLDTLIGSKEYFSTILQHRKDQVEPKIIYTKFPGGKIHHGLLFSDNKHADLILSNFNPDYSYVKDCTTRALSYFANQVGLDISYNQIKEYQEIHSLNTEGTRKHWNYGSVYEDFFKDKLQSCVRIYFQRLISRGRLAILLKDISKPIYTHSRGHVAIIHSGKVIDTWDSRRGRVGYIIGQFTEEEIGRIQKKIPIWKIDHL